MADREEAVYLAKLAEQVHFCALVEGEQKESSKRAREREREDAETRRKRRERAKLTTTTDGERKSDSLAP